MTTTRQRLTLGAAALVLVAGLAPGIAAGADLGNVDRPIRIAMLEWTGAQISAMLAGHVLEQAGYRVEYVTAGNFPQFSGLADGTLSASVEIWMNNVGEIFPTALEAGQIEDLGPLGLETNEGWIYPLFVEEHCPGLPDWTALTDPQCVAALATPDTLPLGRFLDYPADWGSRAAQIIEDNNLPLVAVPAGSEGAMIAELRAATAARTPLVLMFWAPHYILADVEVGWIDLPPCLHDVPEHCITPPDVHKIVWSGFAEEWPAAYEILRAFQVSTADQQAMMLRVDELGEPLARVAAEWVAENAAIWRPWVEAALN